MNVCERVSMFDWCSPLYTLEQSVNYSPHPTGGRGSCCHVNEPQGHSTTGGDPYIRTIPKSVQDLTKFSNMTNTLSAKVSDSINASQYTMFHWCQPTPNRPAIPPSTCLYMQSVSNGATGTIFYDLVYRGRVSNLQHSVL